MPRSDQVWAREAARAAIPTDMLYMIPRVYESQPAIFYRYGDPLPDFRGCVVLHARTRDHCRERNWRLAWWHMLARWLFGKGVERLVCIGSPTAAQVVEGACDMRAAGLQTQMDILASAWFAVGMSSGPMHLASLCGCPHVVWCGGAQGEWAATKKRYEHTWNPFDTAVSANAYNSWQPEPGTVESWVSAFMEKLGGYTDRDPNKPRRANRGGPVLG